VVKYRKGEANTRARERVYYKGSLSHAVEEWGTYSVQEGRNVGKTRIIGQHEKEKGKVLSNSTSQSDVPGTEGSVQNGKNECRRRKERGVQQHDSQKNRIIPTPMEWESSLHLRWEEESLFVV